jgi:cation diffusion facilitator CzcD-associated flavoprotein CzcO
MSLEDLNARVKADLGLLNYGAPTWVHPRTHPDGHVYDVVIVGGGQSGLGAAFGLLRERISNILVIDENPAGGEGPWDTYARMVTLRSPKHLTSIDLGIPSLTSRAWWEARYGADSWTAVDKFPRPEWMNYLRWFRDVLALPVRNDTRLTLVEPLDGLYRLHLDGQPPLLARKVVLATGIQGGGEWHVPPMIKDHLSPKLYAHTSGPVDFEALAGKKIGILGGGASSFDNAQHGLKAGVAEAHVFVRRPELPRVNVMRHLEAAGIISRFPVMNDGEKYALMASFFRLNQPPTNDTFERACALPGFHLHLGAPWLAVAEREGQAVVTTPQGEYVFDFLLVGTGMVTDPALRPELRLVEPGILRWRDTFVPPTDLANPLLDAHPYLGEDFAYLGRNPEAEHIVGGIYPFNYSAMINFGISASALSGLKQALPRLIKGVADALFLDDRDKVMAAYLAFDEHEFTAAWPR